MLYEARCIDRHFSTYGDPIYFVHYKGWKNTWNEWVNETRILTKNNVNIVHMHNLNERIKKDLK